MNREKYMSDWFTSEQEEADKNDGANNRSM